MTQQKETQHQQVPTIPPVRLSPSSVREAPDLWAMRYGTTSARALYLHAPFCAQKCRYCDFTSYATRENDPLMSRYVMMLQHQIDHLGGIKLLEECSTIYVGGGTPSMLGIWLGWLCETATRWCDAREVTCEANPESLTTEMLDVMVHNGVTAFLVTFSNPLIIFLFMGCYAQLAFVVPNHPLEMCVGYLSIVLGALLWWYGLTWLIDKIRGNFTTNGIVIINRVIGSAVMIFSLLILFGTLFNIYHLH